MRYLFHSTSLRQLKQLPPKLTLLAFDFDGTLAKITRDPSETKLTLTTAALLRELSKFSCLAIISGRSIRDLKPRLSFQPKYIFGNHGIESADSDDPKLKQMIKTCSQWKRSLRRNTRFINCIPSIFIEDKKLSLSIHYRSQSNKAKSKKLILEAVSALQPAPKIILGKYVVNILPENSSNKGTALLEAIHKNQAKAAFYIGDEETDEAVFRLKNTSVFTVRVGKKASSSAHYFIKRQAEINKVLRALLKHFQEPIPSS